MEYFSNPPAPCASERLPKPKEAPLADQEKRKLFDDDNGEKRLIFTLNDQMISCFMF